MYQKRFETGGTFPAAGPAAPVLGAMLAAAALFFLGSCNMPTGQDTETNRNVFNDLPYGSHEKQKLDLVFPDIPENISAPIPAVLYIHGGSWIDGDKDDDTFDTLKTSAAGTGLATASMNYRLLNFEKPSETGCEDMLDDVHDAIDLVKKKSSELGVEINRLCIIGVSAGAHLALLYSYTRAGQSSLPVEFCVSASGPTDFTDPAWYSGDAADGSPIPLPLKLLLVSALAGESFTQDDLQGGQINPAKEQVLKKISPVEYAGGAVPTFFAHGRKDTVVPFSNAERLEKALPAEKKLGFLEFPNSGHGLNAPEDSSILDDFYAKIKDLFTKLNS
ncbi:MAG: alpha/beta hydrolase [Treponema sp.]|jgi:acetyl esterase/lipase|nr:alpha/beta hydrolase [Treponema sp.]